MNLLWPGSLILVDLDPADRGGLYLAVAATTAFCGPLFQPVLGTRGSSHQSWVRRHLPFILFLLALASLVFALGRPVATVTVPSNKATIMLTIDVSRSMCST